MSLNLDKSTWERVRFGDVVKNVNETVRVAAAAGIDRVIGLEHLDPGEIEISRWGDDPASTTFTKRVRPGQTLFGKRRAYQRKAAFAEFGAITSGDILTFEAMPGRLLPELLPFLVHSERFFANALETSAGSLSPRTNWGDLAKFDLALPPLAEQRRLADLLWATEYHRRALVGKLDVLDTARSRLIAHSARQVEDLVAIRSLQDSRFQVVQVGPFGGSLASRHFTRTGTRVLKIQNLDGSGGWDLGHDVRVSDSHAATLARYAVRAGDVVIAAQATVGRSGLVPEHLAGALISQHLIRVRVDSERCLPAYLALMIADTGFQAQIASVKSKTTRDGLNTDDVARFQIPYQSVAAQRALVDAVGDFDSARRAAQHERHALWNLRARLIASAFEGLD